MKKVFGLMVGMLLAQSLCAQQDPQYSQYMFNQVVINPAYVGSREALSAAMDLRKQWIAMEGSPRTGTISLHGPLRIKSIGLGGHLINEAIGPSKWNAAYFDFAYRFRLGKGKLSLGLAGGLVSYNMNLKQTDYKDQGEVFPSQNVGARTKFDASTGFYYYTNSFYIGGSATHINRPNLYSDTYYFTNAQAQPDTAYVNFSLRPHAFLYIGKGFLVNDNLVINPSVLIKNDNSARMGVIDLNCNFLLRKKLWLGLSFRSGYGGVLLAQYAVNEQLRIGYSYDRGFNRIGAAGGGSHEIMIGYNFNIFKSKMLSPRYL
jgi:type IX secretion system PorP/SprF family membrane protein